MNIGEAIKTISFHKPTKVKNQLVTKWGEKIIRQRKKGEEIIPLPEYPRPQLRRMACRILNGYWNYAFTSTQKEPTRYEGNILVPYSPESLLSGVGRQLTPEEWLWYERKISFTDQELTSKKRLLLHFGAVDEACTVYWNEEKLFQHKGGYLPFTIELTGKIQPLNTLKVQVKDESDTSYHARGKQSLDADGLFYTAQSGIWQTVWMEWVPENYVEKIRLTPLYDEKMLHLEICFNLNKCLKQTKKLSFKTEVLARGTKINCKKESKAKIIAKGTKILIKETITIPKDNFYSWSPENPFLYDLRICVEEDEILSYFAMRKYSIGLDENKIPRLYLNNKPYYQQGILDQGYWPDGLMTPPSDKAYRYDIELAKKHGFNMIRKHIKIESLRWYYHCDKEGILVWQDIVNGGEKYDLFKLTFLPSAIPYLRSHMNDKKYQIFSRENLEGRKEWLKECRETIRHLYNLPCICMWVAFNEGWGQFESIRVADMIDKLDKTRWIDHASGWVDQRGRDVKSIHNYFQKLTIKTEQRPTVYSEYGGYAYYIKDHSYSNQIFGYRRFKTIEGYQKAFWKLQKKIRRLQQKGLSASVYTQISDIEDEVNGIVTYDRKIEKL